MKKMNNNGVHKKMNNIGVHLGATNILEKMKKPPRKNEDENFQLLYYFIYVVKNGIRRFPNP